MEFTLKIDKKAQARINPGRCINCGECRRICPTEAISEYQKPVSGLFSGHTADMTESSCSAGCPVGIIPQTVASFIRQGHALKAYSHIAERTPMPWLCSEICKGPCYDHCKLLNVGEDPIDMHALEKLAVREGEPAVSEFTPPAYDKIAIIGGGPAGIMAAFELRKMGYRPVIFEKRDRLGGAVSWGIADIRLNKKTMHEEIDSVINAGIEVRYNYSLGENFSLDQIWREDFAACLLATGLSEPAEYDLPGSGCRGVFRGMDILMETNDGGYSDREKATAPSGLESMGKNIVILGKGNMLLEVASVIAASERDVTVIVEKHANQTDADRPEEAGLGESEIESLEHMGITVREVSSVRQIISDPDGVKAVEILNEGRASNLFCDGVVVAFGRKINVEKIAMVETTRAGRIKTDGSFRTNKEGIYACGQVAGGRQSVVESLASGRMAARAIDRDLRGTGEEEGREGFYPASEGETIYPENILTDRDFRAIGKPGENCIDDIVSVLRFAGIQERMPLFFKDDGPRDDRGIKKVAIAGGGIAGITAAIALAKRGVRPTIFETTARLGGSCRWLSTNRRYDRALMDRETAKLEESGIEVVYNASAGIRPDLLQLIREYDAVLLAMGETLGKKPDIKGADAKGVFDVVSLMGQFNNGRIPDGVGDRVVVVGNDDVSVDIARAMKRLCREVTLLSLFGKGKLQVETPASRLMQDEGVNLVTGVEVTKVEVKNDAVDGVVCNVVSKGSSLGVPCDTVIFGQGKGPDTEALSLRNLHLDMEPEGYVKINSKLATNMRGVFAIGDFNMSSIDAGKAGAVAVSNYLFGENESIVVETFRPEEVAVEHERISGKTGIIAQPEASPTLADEGERCINCGYHLSDEMRCIGCGICQKYCPTGAIWMEGTERQQDPGRIVNE